MMKTTIPIVGDDPAGRNELNLEEAEKLDGKLDSNPSDEDKLMRSIIEDDSAGSDGKLIEEASNQGLGAFVPDIMFSKITQNYKQAEQIYGEKIIREVTDNSPDFVEKNAKVPEFQRELKSKIGQRIKQMKQKGLLDKEGFIKDKGYKLASLVMYTEELDKLESQGLLGEVSNKKKSHYGSREESNFYKKGDRYQDIDIKKTIKTVTRRGHKKIDSKDLKIFQREAKGSVEIIYAIDASGSMKGRKIEMSKKAGVALSYKAIENKDKVGIIIFGSDVKNKISPTTNFNEIIELLAKAGASKETNFENAIKESFEMFSHNTNATKHLIFITDGMPTTGEDPEKNSLDAIAQASAAGITCSMIGIEIGQESVEFMKEAAQLGAGKFHNVRNLDNLDLIVLEDYASQ